MVRQIVIGDIHGCYDELCALLDVVAPASDDQIITIGDVVDRGPENEKVLEFLRDQPNAASLMGNHERKHIRSAKGEVRPALSQVITRAQLGERYEGWLEFMGGFARHLELPEAILVHGMLEPGVPLDQQRDTVVIGTLSGEHYLERTYSQPWYDLYEGPKPVIVGHLDYLGTGEPLVRDGKVYAIDTGCVRHGRLTALVLPEFRIVSVPAHANHWARTRRRYAVLAGSSRSDLDLGWKLLDAFAESARDGELPPALQKRAEDCAAIVTRCEHIIDEVTRAAKALCAEILKGLRQADDWDTCSLKKQAARYAERARNHPAATLLFLARTGKLDGEAVRRLAKTPRQLASMAQQLGINAHGIASSGTG